jgi:serine/threonine-protein kinase
MGVVYEAEHLVTHRRVALKLMRWNQRWTKAGVERFLREAVLTTSISHPNIVDVLDAGTDEDGTPYIALEFLRGASVAALLGHRTKLAVAEACWVAAEVLAGLAASHAIGIVHRDVKPENVFIADNHHGERRVKLLDFGISRVFTEADGAALRPVTRAGRVLGTTEYMSPEQLRADAALDGRTDLWSLGVMLYEMIAGSRPFGGSSEAVVSHNILSTGHVPLAEVAQVPDALSALVDRALAKDPDRRFQSADEMQAALRALIPLLPASLSAPPLMGEHGAETTVRSGETSIPRLAPLASFAPPARHLTLAGQPPANDPVDRSAPTPAAPEPPREPAAPAPPAAGASAPRWVGAAVVLVFFAAVAALAFGSRSPSPPPRAPAAESPVATPPVAAPPAALAPAVLAPAVLAPAVLAPAVVAPPVVAPRPVAAVRAAPRPGPRPVRPAHAAPAGHAAPVRNFDGL